MRNKYGYGIHGLGTSECPNCGTPTERYSFTTPSVGVNCSRCPTCAPLWLKAVAPLSALAVVLAAFLLYTHWVWGILGVPAGVLSGVAVVLVALRVWPRVRGATA